MKCQILFSGKSKKNIINLSSAENAQRVVKVNLLPLSANSQDDKLVIFFYFPRKQALTIHANYLHFQKIGFD